MSLGHHQGAAPLTSPDRPSREPTLYLPECSLSPPRLHPFLEIDQVRHPQPAFRSAATELSPEGPGMGVVLEQICPPRSSFLLLHTVLLRHCVSPPICLAPALPSSLGEEDCGWDAAVRGLLESSDTQRHPPPTTSPATPHLSPQPHTNHNLKM